MIHSNQNLPVLEMRISLTSRDFKKAVEFYCAGLGIEPAAIWENEQGKARLLTMGAASLEIFDEQQAAMIDQLEAGRRVSGKIRLALQVPDLMSAMGRLLEHGAIQIHPPVMTPWGDYNVRLQDPDGMQITLFQKPEPKGK